MPSFLKIKRLSLITEEDQERFDYPSPHKLAEEMVPGWQTYAVNILFSKIITQIFENAENKTGMTNVVFNGPPSHSKTHFVGKALPIWIHNKYPWSHGSMITHTERQSMKSTVFCRDVITANPHRLNVKLQRGQKLKQEFYTTAGGMYRGSGVEGGIQGDHYDWVIIDDIYKNRQQAQSIAYNIFLDDWFSDTFRTRLNPNAVKIWSITKWHNEDLLSRVLKRSRENPDADQYIQVILPAMAEEDPEHDYWMDSETEEIVQVLKGERKPKGLTKPVKVLDYMGRTKEGEPLVPERYGRKELVQIRASVTKQTWRALYQCRPDQSDNQMFDPRLYRRLYLNKKRTHFWFVDDKGERKNIHVKNVRFFLWGDSALKGGEANDYTAISCCGFTRKNRLIVFDMFRDQIPGFKVFNAFQAMLKKHPQVISSFVEDQGSGSIAIQIAEEKGFELNPLKADRNKEIRAEPLQMMYERGEVFHYAGYENKDGSLSEEPDWLPVFEAELRAFPLGKHDDQVDTVAYAADCLFKELKEIEDYGLTWGSEFSVMQVKKVEKKSYREKAFGKDNDDDNWSY